jgi:hypothetical protein
MFDFLMHGFKETSRDRLLEMLAGAPDLEQLKVLTREELLEIVADRQTCSFFNQHAPMAVRTKTNGRQQPGNSSGTVNGRR